MRAHFFGPDASTAPQTDRLLSRVRGRSGRSTSTSATATRVEPRLRATHAASLELVIHTAAQPSHDWAASEPHTDFTVNANGTLNLLEATRLHKPDATFVFMLDEQGLRRPAEPAAARGARDPPRAARQDHEYFDGIPTTMSIDQLPALAVRRLEGRGRPDGPGVRPLLRHADRLLPRRLPHRPEPRRRAAARLPRRT